MTEKQLFKKHRIKIKLYLGACWILVDHSSVPKSVYRGRAKKWKNQPIIHDPFGNKREALTSIIEELKGERL